MTSNPFDGLLEPPPPPMDTYRFATVTSTSPLRIRLDGDDDPVASTPVTLAVVSISDRVWVQLHAKQLIILGVVNG